MTLEKKILLNIGIITGILGVFILFHSRNTVRYPVDHPVVGIWEYTSGGKPHQREFTSDGKCILSYAGGETIWVHPFEVVNSEEIDVVGAKGKKLHHELLADGRLNIEGRFVATRVESRTETR